MALVVMKSTFLFIWVNQTSTYPSPKTSTLRPKPRIPDVWWKTLIHRRWTRKSRCGEGPLQHPELKFPNGSQQEKGTLCPWGEGKKNVCNSAIGCYLIHINVLVIVDNKVCSLGSTYTPEDTGVQLQGCIELMEFFK